TVDAARCLAIDGRRWGNIRSLIGLPRVPLGGLPRPAAAYAWHNTIPSIIEQKLLSLGYLLLAATLVRLAMPCASRQQPLHLGIRNARFHGAPPLKWNLVVEIPLACAHHGRPLDLLVFCPERQ